MGLDTGPKMPEQFNWISFIDILADGDILKYPLIDELDYEECLFKYLYEHYKDKYTKELNRRQEIRNRIR